MLKPLYCTDKSNNSKLYRCAKCYHMLATAICFESIKALINISLCWKSYPYAIGYNKVNSWLFIQTEIWNTNYTQFRISYPQNNP